MARNKNKTVIFQFFALVFRKIDTGDMFSRTGGASDSATPLTPEEGMERSFKTNAQISLPVLVRRGSGQDEETELKKYNADVLRSENLVTMLFLEDNRYKKTINDYKETVHEHHPYCHVVIDCRSGFRLVGIEHSPAFGGKPEKAAAVLAEGLSGIMWKYGYSVELLPMKKRTEDFWGVVNEVRSKFNDRVKQIRLDFAGADEVTAEPAADDVVALMQTMARAAGADFTYGLTAREDGEVDIEAVRSDVNNMAAICMQRRNYVLSVKFRHFGVYRYGSPLNMEIGVDSEVLKCFENGQVETDFENEGNPTYALTAWLDRLQTIMDQYEKESADEPRHRLRRRR